MACHVRGLTGFCRAPQRNVTCPRHQVEVDLLKIIKTKTHIRGSLDVWPSHAGRRRPSFRAKMAVFLFRPRQSKHSAAKTGPLPEPRPRQVVRELNDAKPRSPVVTLQPLDPWNCGHCPNCVPTRSVHDIQHHPALAGKSSQRFSGWLVPCWQCWKTPPTNFENQFMV